jgi:hypothetical protein
VDDVLLCTLKGVASENVSPPFAVINRRSHSLLSLRLKGIGLVEHVCLGISLFAIADRRSSLGCLWLVAGGFW